VKNPENDPFGVDPDEKSNEASDEGRCGRMMRYLQYCSCIFQRLPASSSERSREVRYQISELGISDLGVSDLSVFHGLIIDPVVDPELPLTCMDTLLDRYIQDT
jgi:hypothetical protein